MLLHSLTLKGLGQTLHPRHQAKISPAICTAVSSLSSISPPLSQAPWQGLSFVRIHDFRELAAQWSCSPFLPLLIFQSTTLRAIPHKESCYSRIATGGSAFFQRGCLVIWHYRMGRIAGLS